MTSSLNEYMNNIHTVYKNSLSEDAHTIDTPPSLKCELHAHQKAIASRMETIEKELTSGVMHNDDECMYSNYAILGDSVGVGKSLMVLAHIARVDKLPPLLKNNMLNKFSSSNFFSIKSCKYSKLTEAGCLIIIPHTLFRQWSEYIETQTTLSHFCIARLNQIDSTTFRENVLSAQVVLVSNTSLKPFIKKSNDDNLKWKRVFIDEADTIYMPGISIRESIKTNFIWFITASWINLMYLNMNLYFDKDRVQSILNDNSVPAYIKLQFKSRLKTTYYYYTEMLRVRSQPFLRDILTITHPLRSKIVLRCSEEYINKSISLPQLIKEILICRSPVSNSVLSNVVSHSMKQMLDAGDIEGALSSLGVKGKTANELIQTVTTMLKKDLQRLEATYKFKEELTYSSQTVKEAALLSLKEKINKTTESIKSIEDRIENLRNSSCPICFEPSDTLLVTQCCSQAFCTPCLVGSMAIKAACPLCRTAMNISSCSKLLLHDVSNNAIVEKGHDELPTKIEALLNIIKSNPMGKFLIFSKYDNPFDNLENKLSELNMRVKHLKGNKDSIKMTLDKFESGQIQCLLLNSQFAGAGLNITAASHVILLHSMSHEEEKQILGRAYRVGREGALTFIKLLHDSENDYSDAS
jgi:SNF2 family DNA or RNA helicase